MTHALSCIYMNPVYDLAIYYHYTTSPYLGQVSQNLDGNFCELQLPSVHRSKPSLPELTAAQLNRGPVKPVGGL